MSLVLLKRDFRHPYEVNLYLEFLKFLMVIILIAIYKKSNDVPSINKGCNCGPDLYQNCSRDPARTPMQWSGSEINAGFSNSDHTWLPVNPNYISVNVDSELADPFSHLNIYKRLIEARKSDLVFDFGEFKGITVNNILAFSRSVDLFFYQTVTFVNFNSEQVTYDFSEIFGYRFQSGLIYVSTQGTGEG